MIILVCFLGITLSVIYFSSYMEVYKRNTSMLKVYAKEYWKNGNPEGKLPAPPPLSSNASDNHTYQLSMFHAIAFSDNGEVITVDNSEKTGITDNYLIKLCAPLINQNKENGVKDNWIYHIEHNGNTTLIVLMDNEVMSDNIATLFRNTIIFSSFAIIIMLFLSIRIASLIVNPLEENHRKQKQFISDAGHELKTPLAVINTNAEVLERASGENKWLDNIKFEIKQMNGLIQQLLELANIENSVLKMDNLNLSKIVTGAALPFECTAFEQNKTLEIKVKDDIYINGNAEKLNNLVSNLIDNAIEYSNENTEVLISLKAEHNTAVLSVINQGDPIPQIEKEALFDRFYRVDKARPRNSSHYGLGLAIVKVIVSDHNGKISVDCINNKVIFTVALPLVL